MSKRCTAKRGYHSSENAALHCPVHRNSAISNERLMKEKEKLEVSNLSDEARNRIIKRREEGIQRIQAHDDEINKILNSQKPLTAEKINTLFDNLTGMPDTHYNWDKSLSVNYCNWSTLEEFVNFEDRELPTSVASTDDLGEVNIEATTFKDMHRDDLGYTNGTFYAVFSCDHPMTGERVYFKRTGEQGSHGNTSDFSTGETTMVSPVERERVIYETDWVAKQEPS